MAKSCTRARRGSRELPQQDANIAKPHRTLPRSSVDDSGDSQFFVNLKDNFRLNGMYEVFGKVIKGQNVIDRIQRGDRIKSIRRV